MTDFIRLGYVFLGAWVLLSIVGIVVFFIIANNFKKKRNKSYEEYRKGYEELKKRQNKHEGCKDYDIKFFR